MKYLLSVLLSLSWAMNAYTQSAGGINVLKPGDQVPDIEFQYVANGPYQKAKLSDYRGKLLLLGFWSMYCAPCIKNFPNMDSLQQQFNGKLDIVLVNVDRNNVSKEKITSFIQKWETNKQQPLRLPTIYSDSVPAILFNCIYPPHYAWISPSGRLLALTGTEEVNAHRISQLLSEETTILPIKNDIKINWPLFANEHLPVDQLISHSVMIKGVYNGLLGSRYYFTKDAIPYGVNIANQPLITLLQEVICRLDKEMTDKRILIDAGARADSNSIQAMKKALMETIYTMGLIVPKDRPQQLLPAFLAAINQFTDYRISFEERVVPTYALVSLGNKETLRTKGASPKTALYYTEKPVLQNNSLSNLLTLLNKVPEIPLPVLDQTGILFNVDLHFEQPLQEFSVIRKELLRYKLAFKEQKARIKVLVIRKK